MKYPEYGIKGQLCFFNGLFCPLMSVSDEYTFVSCKGFVVRPVKTGRTVRRPPKGGLPLLYRLSVALPHGVGSTGRTEIFP